MSNRADATAITDEGTTRADLNHSRQYVYNPNTLLWERMTQPGTSGSGGGAATIADGADVAQGTTTDTSAANTVVGILKAIKAAVQGTLTVATHAVTQSGTWTVQPGNTANTTAWKVDGSAVTQPVSGTFWQATQPVSIAATVTVAGTVTANIGSSGSLALDATLTGGTQKTKLVDTGGVNVASISAANALKVDGSAVTQPVSGTFWQATQPVSGTFWQATQPVSGTFFQTTQPVSEADGANVVLGASTDTNASATIHGKLIKILNAQQAGDTGGTNTAAAWLIQGTDLVTRRNVRLNAKGTQGDFGIAVQELHDAGRNTRIFALDTITAAPLAEAVQTVVQWYGNAAVAGTTQPAVVPAGKTLRLTGYKIQYQSLATVGYAVVRIRCNTAGLGVLASPLVASFEAGTNSGATTTAVTGAVTTETGEFPDGLEIPAAAGLAFSMAGYGPTGTLTLEGGVRFQVFGYEY